MTLWFRAHADEIDTWFYYEFGDDRLIARQIELEGPGQEPVVAASRSELREAVRAGKAEEYRSRFGWPGDGLFDPDHDYDIPGQQELTLEEFETAWARARERIQNRPPAVGS